jgi:hypothetical protein
MEVAGNSTICHAVGIGDLSVLKVPLYMDPSLQQVLDLNLTDGGTAIHKLDIPIADSGCRVTYFSIESMGVSLCLVHESVKCVSDVDLFIEEQDFTYACMDIQENLFLRHNRAMSISPRPPEDLDLSKELEAMQFLLNKYMPTIDS